MLLSSLLPLWLRITAVMGFLNLDPVRDCDLTFLLYRYKFGSLDFVVSVTVNMLFLTVQCK